MTETAVPIWRRGCAMMLEVTMTISSGGACCAAPDNGANTDATAATIAVRGLVVKDFIALASFLRGRRQARDKLTWQRVTTLLRSAPRLTEREPTCPAGLLAYRFDSPRLPGARAPVAYRSESFAANSCGGSPGFEEDL